MIDPMQSSMAIVAALAVGVPVVFAVIISIIMFAGRARPEQGLGVHHATPSGLANGTWNGEVLGGGLMGATGGTLGSTFGLMRVDAGAVSFTPEGAASPVWSTPCSAVGARSRSVLAFNGADVELWGQNWHLRCNVSREHINRFSRNSIKTMRQRRYAAEFLRVLASNGAHVVTA